MLGATSPSSMSAGEVPTAVDGGKPRVQEFSALGGDLALVGVIIAADRRLALVRSHSAGLGGIQVLSVGGSVSGHRLTEIQADRIIFETPDGERVVVRLSAGGDVTASSRGDDGIVTPSRADHVAEAPAPPPQLSRAARRRLERARLEAERAASGSPANTPGALTD
jgi:hypothetical protein